MSNAENNNNPNNADQAVLKNKKDKVKKQKRVLTPEEKKKRLKVMILAIVFFLLIFILYQQMMLGSQLTKLSDEIKTSGDNFESFQVNQNNLIGSLSKKVDAASQSIQEASKTINQLNSGQSKILSATTNTQTQLKQLESALAKQITDLRTFLAGTEQKFSNLEKNNSTQPATNLNTSQYKKTDEYKIYGVAPYGVILQDKQGQFSVAQINKPLSVGKIDAISKNEVIAGDYIITP